MARMYNVIEVKQSRRAIAALRAAGASPRYTEYADVGHACGSTDLLKAWLRRLAHVPYSGHGSIPKRSLGDLGIDPDKRSGFLSGAGPAAEVPGTAHRPAGCGPGPTRQRGPRLVAPGDLHVSARRLDAFSRQYVDPLPVRR